MSAVIAHLQPEGAIIVDESLTSGGSYWELSKVTSLLDDLLPTVEWCTATLVSSAPTYEPCGDTRLDSVQENVCPKDQVRCCGLARDRLVWQ